MSKTLGGYKCHRETEKGREGKERGNGNIAAQQLSQLNPLRNRHQGL